MNYIKPYLRGWPIIVLFMVVSYLLAAKYLNYVTPMYESTAKLRIADMNEGVHNSNLFKNLDVFVNSQKINAEIELLKSQSIVKRALGIVSFETLILRVGTIQHTELYNNSPIIINPINWNEGLNDKLFKLKIESSSTYIISVDNGLEYAGKLGDTIVFENAELQISLNKLLLNEKKSLDVSGNYAFSILSLSKQLSEINKNLDIISVDKDIPVIRISYKSPNAHKAAVFPNALAQAYIEDYIENKYSAASITSDFLNERINEVGDKLNGTEESILKYRENEKITNIRQETETDLRRISQLKIQQTSLKMSLEAVKDLENYIKKGKGKFLELAPNFEAFTDLLSTEIVKNIKQLQAEKKDLLLQYTLNSENVKVIDDKINDLVSYLIESISNTRKNLETKYNKLFNDIDIAEKVFVSVPEKEKKMTILNREFEIYQQSYNFLNQKLIEAEIAKAAKIAFHRIITPASLSFVPVSPNRVIIKIVSTMLGLFAALFLIFVVHALKARVNDVSTIEANSLVPMVLAVPKFKNESQINAFFTKTVSEWEVKQLIPSAKIICFTGYDRKQGVDFIAKHIQYIFVNQKRRVMFVQFYTDNACTRTAFYYEDADDSNVLKVFINEAFLHAVSLNEWKSFWDKKIAFFDQTIIVNSNFGAAFTMATMALSNLNIVCVDARLTPAKKIVEVDLFKEEFNLPNVFWALNRVGYNPSFFRDCKLFVFKLLNKIIPNDFTL